MANVGRFINCSAKFQRMNLKPRCLLSFTAHDNKNYKGIKHGNRQAETACCALAQRS